ncbi:MAG: hypothetical protein ACOC93_05895, partial [Planctomycetota bacterium]
EDLIRLAVDCLYDGNVPDAEIAQFCDEARRGDAREVLGRWADLVICDGLEDELMRWPERVELDEAWVPPVRAARSGNLRPAIDKMLELVGDARPPWLDAMLDRLPREGGAAAARPLLDYLLELVKDQMPPRAVHALRTLRRGTREDKGGRPPNYSTGSELIQRPRVRGLLSYRRFRASGIPREEAITLAVNDTYGSNLSEDDQQDYEAQLENDLHNQGRLMK